jgi:hypothetical protein
LLFEHPLHKIPPTGLTTLSPPVAADEISTT